MTRIKVAGLAAGGVFVLCILGFAAYGTRQAFFASKVGVEHDSMFNQLRKTAGETKLVVAEQGKNIQALQKATAANSKAVEAAAKQAEYAITVATNNRSNVEALNRFRLRVEEKGSPLVTAAPPAAPAAPAAKPAAEDTSWTSYDDSSKLWEAKRAFWSKCGVDAPDDFDAATQQMIIGAKTEADMKSKLVCGAKPQESTKPAQAASADKCHIVHFNGKPTCVTDLVGRDPKQFN